MEDYVRRGGSLLCTQYKMKYFKSKVIWNLILVSWCMNVLRFCNASMLKIKFVGF